MGILKDIGRLATVAGEARRAVKFLTEMAGLKEKIQALTVQLNLTEKRAKRLEAAIRKHKAEMADCPRSWEADQELWKVLEG